MNLQALEARLSALRQPPSAAAPSADAPTLQQRFGELRGPSASIPLAELGSRYSALVGGAPLPAGGSSSGGAPTGPMVPLGSTAPAGAGKGVPFPAPVHSAALDEDLLFQELSSEASLGAHLPRGPSLQQRFDGLRGVSSTAAAGPDLEARFGALTGGGTAGPTAATVPGAVALGSAAPAGLRPSAAVPRAAAPVSEEERLWDELRSEAMLGRAGPVPQGSNPLATAHPPSSAELYGIDWGGTTEDMDELNRVVAEAMSEATLAQLSYQPPEDSGTPVDPAPRAHLRAKPAAKPGKHKPVPPRRRSFHTSDDDDSLSDDSSSSHYSDYY